MGEQAEPTDEPGAVGAQRLNERDEAMLDFEHRWWRHAGAKEEAIRVQFGLSASRYYQLLNALIDSPAAIVYDPMLVRRLQRVRDARTSARSARIGLNEPSERATRLRRARADD